MMKFLKYILMTIVFTICIIPAIVIFLVKESFELAEIISGIFDTDLRE